MAHPYIGDAEYDDKPVQYDSHRGSLTCGCLDDGSYCSHQHPDSDAASRDQYPDSCSASQGHSPYQVHGTSAAFVIDQGNDARISLPSQDVLGHSGGHGVSHVASSPSQGATDYSHDLALQQIVSRVLQNTTGKPESQVNPRVAIPPSQNTTGQPEAHGNPRVAIPRSQNSGLLTLPGRAPHSGNVNPIRSRFKLREEEFLCAILDLIQYPKPNLRHEISNMFGSPSTEHRVDVSFLPLSILNH